MDVVHFDVIVRGLVQGVWYRHTAVQMAQSLGLAGHVMNHEDGTVRIAVEGLEAQIEEFLVWCSKGPPQAEVTAVERLPGKVQGYKSFDVRR